jgi:hypothetical protein
MCAQDSPGKPLLQAVLIAKKRAVSYQQSAFNSSTLDKDQPAD